MVMVMMDTAVAANAERTRRDPTAASVRTPIRRIRYFHTILYSCMNTCRSLESECCGHQSNFLSAPQFGLGSKYSSPDVGAHFPVGFQDAETAELSSRQLPNLLSRGNLNQSVARRGA